MANKKENRKKLAKWCQFVWNVWCNFESECKLGTRKGFFFQCIMAKPEIATLLELQIVVSQNESFFQQLSQNFITNYFSDLVECKRIALAFGKLFILPFFLNSPLKTRYCYVKSFLSSLPHCKISRVFGDPQH